jgi:hypothetical protein
MDIISSMTPGNSTQGTMDAILERSDEQQFGAPIYAFNVYPASAGEIVNMFQLFKATDGWRLISAGVAQSGKIMTLRAIDPSIRFSCTGTPPP